MQKTKLVVFKHRSLMDILTFIATVILITVSGALAPGPLFFATLSHGVKSGARGGLVFSVAHSLVEFTLVILLALGLLTVANKPLVQISTGVTGGAVLLVFGAIQIRNALKFQSNEITSHVRPRNLFLLGLAFTGLNPFFIIWWLTVGANLIILALEFASLGGVVFMYLCHVWMDYVWLTLVAHFAQMGTSLVGFKWYRFIMVVFGVFLLYFGLAFLIDSLSTQYTALN